MKAWVGEKYGPPEGLQLADVARPVPNADQVLLKVLAASVNAADWHSMRAKPAFSRAALGWVRPKHPILGVDVAGRVDSVGRGVTRYRSGDEVYANLLDHGYGGFAEFVAVPLEVMAPKPGNLSFEEAAAVPMAGVTALQGLRHHGEIQPTQKVLINGGSGGVGSFAVQLAKAFGAEVTVVTSSDNVDMVRSLGADHVVDYTTTDFADSGDRYDLILDTVGNRSAPDLKRALAPAGKVAVTGFTSVAKLMGVSLREGKDVARVEAHVAMSDLEFLSDLSRMARCVRRSTVALHSPRFPRPSPIWSWVTPRARLSWRCRDDPRSRDRLRRRGGRRWSGRLERCAREASFRNGAKSPERRVQRRIPCLRYPTLAIRPQRSYAYTVPPALGSPPQAVRGRSGVVEVSPDQCVEL